MNKIKFIAIFCLLASCNGKETSTIQDMIDGKHIDGKVVETKFLRDVTAKDSVKYYEREFLKMLTSDLYPPAVETIEQAINYAENPPTFEWSKKEPSPKYKTDIIFFGVIKKEIEKYSEMENKLLGKVFETTIKIDGQAFPEKMDICLTPDLEKVLGAIK